MNRSIHSTQVASVAVTANFSLDSGQQTSEPTRSELLWPSSAVAGRSTRGLLKLDWQGASVHFPL